MEAAFALYRDGRKSHESGPDESTFQVEIEGCGVENQSPTADIITVDL